jgi:hypothetical protein
MPFSAPELTQLGYIALDHYMRNNPIDQIAQQRPLLAKLTAKKKSFPGAKQYITEQVRHTYDSNFQWYFGDDQVTYNRKDTVRQASYEWKGAHDGFSLNEDFLLGNGITITDTSGPSTNSGAEMQQLTNLFEENMETLRLGFEESFDLDLHRDGSASTNNIAGLDHLIALDPTTGVVGGIDRATNTWWRNHVATGVLRDGSDMIAHMEEMWRQCTINGGVPDLIIAGGNFVDVFRVAAKGEVSRYAVQQVASHTPGELDPSIRQDNGATYTGLHFQGVPIVYDPSFQVLDAADSPATPWEDRCYFINTKHMRLRPAQGHDMIPRKPPRDHDYYIYYWGLTWKGALTMNRSNAHGVLALAP